MAREAIERREPGGAVWREQVRKLIRAEEEELHVVEQLAERENDTHKLRCFVSMAGRKAGKVTLLNELLRYNGS